MSSQDKLYYTYDQIHELVYSRQEQIITFSPDIIIAIGTGGFIPARIIKSITETELYAVIISFYNDSNEKMNYPIVKQWISNDIIEQYKGKRILIVDELDDTRNTLSFVQSEISQSMQPSKIGIFVVHNKLKDKESEIDSNCEYISCEEVEDKWIVYPWE